MCVQPFSAFGLSPFALVGGNFNNGANCGFWYWNLNNDSSIANVNRGCRVLIFEIKIIYTSFSLPLGKNRVETGLA